MDKKYYLFRHALATLSNHGYGRKKLTAGILPQGIPPVKKIAEYLKKIPDTTNISSEILRCRQTAEIVSSITNKKFIYDPRLNEFYHEKFSQFKERIKSFLDSLINNKNNIIICTHGAVIAGITRFLLSQKFVLHDQYDYPKTGELWIIKNNTVEKVSFN